MNTSDLPADLSTQVEIQNTQSAPVVSPAQNQIPMYKTDRGFNIHVVALARDARDNIDLVRIIDIPAPVKQHRIGKNEFEAPTLSEVGGGNRNNFCQVIAGKDGRPVSVDDIHYINTDPTRSNINHGTASVGIGNYFSIGWSMKADSVILIYEIVGLSEYVVPAISNQDDKLKPIAKLTCVLAGYEISTWRSKYVDVPSSLNSLLDATKFRMRNDADIPLYMDIFRMVRPVESLQYIADEALSTEDLFYNQSDYQFMEDVMNEILDIRFAQYEALPENTTKRKVDILRLVETLTLDPSGMFVDITLTPVRNDVQYKTYRLRLTRNNFVEEHSTKTLLERGLTLNHTSFDRLKIDLENRREKTVVVHLTSLR